MDTIFDPRKIEEGVTDGPPAFKHQNALLANVKTHRTAAIIIPGVLTILAVYWFTRKARL